MLTHLCAGSLYRHRQYPKDDERIRINKRGDDSRQIIIVPDLDLVDGNSIIFIDDGDDIHPKECEERIA